MFPQEIPEGICDNEDSGFFCTREADHEPPHIVHGLDDREVARW